MGQLGVPVGLIGDKMAESKKRIESWTKNLKNHDSEVQRRRRLRQIRTEELLAKQLRKKGWGVFSPTVVCDRVGIKNEKLYLIEFKKQEQELRENQEKARKLLPENYKIIYH